TKRTLSVSVPSRSQRSARTGEAPRRSRGVASAPAASRGASCGGLDQQHRLLGDATVARFLSQPDESLELVVQRVGVLQARVHDLEAQVAHRIGLREALEHHLTDALRSDLRRAALLDRRFEVLDEAFDRVRRQLFRGRLADRRGELPSIEFLARPVALQHLDARRLGALARSEALAARVARPSTADGLAVLRFARVDDAGVGMAAGWAAPDHKIRAWRPYI